MPHLFDHLYEEFLRAQDTKSEAAVEDFVDYAIDWLAEHVDRLQIRQDTTGAIQIVVEPLVFELIPARSLHQVQHDITNMSLYDPSRRLPGQNTPDS